MSCMQYKQCVWQIMKMVEELKERNITRNISETSEMKNKD